MSGWWLKLGDVRVRCDRPEFTGDNPWIVAQCLAMLYSPDKENDVEEDDDR